MEVDTTFCSKKSMERVRTGAGGLWEWARIGERGVRRQSERQKTVTKDRTIRDSNIEGVGRKK